MNKRKGKLKRQFQTDSETCDNDGDDDYDEDKDSSAKAALRGQAQKLRSSKATTASSDKKTCCPATSQKELQLRGG